MTATLFRIRDYRHLFGAQLVALAGNGLTTVALGLLAFALAGDNAAAVLGTALAIKMITYVTIAPIAGAYATRFNRRRLLVMLDLVRAGGVVALPFADQIWHVYLLVALMQSASAAFTPTFQATLPDILPKEEHYTRALSYSQLASTLETLLSPLLAAVLISFIDFHWLFAATAVGFLASAVLVVSSSIPDAATGDEDDLVDRILSGVRIFAATPRLRGLLGLNLTVAAVGSIVMVNTVNLVQQDLGRPAADVAWLLTANGAGVLVVALAMPHLLRRSTERTMMITGATIMTGAAIALTAFTVGVGDRWPWPILIGIWTVIGLGSGAVLTPAGNVIRRSSAPHERPALFAAQFSLSHACWLLAYPIAGWVATGFGYTITWTILTVLAVLGTTAARFAWRADEVLPRTSAVSVAESR
ncbi:MFS transporter [Gordonia hydrophobica]|uniref:Multidrug efflux pump Tap n=1 Tax=Gordonia hydrophobica TaxID=40516 RepID=A0ABZ2TZJ6_9ACTN|nr:MFS transporter [Gordonia hydrophobica]MBM7368895.1 MFS family permease [Gordonia hydrophobica]